MKILDCLPISDKDTLAFVGAEGVRLKKHEIIVWVSLTIESAVPWTPTTPRFPAIVDTGHTHTFAVKHQHLRQWCGIRPDMLRPLGHIRHAENRIPLHALRLWLHFNRPGEMAPSLDEPFSLELLGGVAVYPDGQQYPRLPLLGMRAILGNHLRLTIDGERASVTLRTPDWRTRLLAWLA
jgi:hypothetical protein